MSDRCPVCGKYPHRDVCPYKKQKQIGKCRSCRISMFSGEEIWTDDEDNLFCSESCAERYHKIREVSYENC